MDGADPILGALWLRMSSIVQRHRDFKLAYNDVANVRNEGIDWSQLGVKEDVKPDPLYGLMVAVLARNFYAEECPEEDRAIESALRVALKIMRAADKARAALNADAT